MDYENLSPDLSITADLYGVIIFYKLGPNHPNLVSLGEFVQPVAIAYNIANVIAPVVDMVMAKGYKLSNAL
nr:hypothetical protein [Mucilaginibacter sp. L294]